MAEPTTLTKLVQPLRLLAIAAFIPAFPLCLAHGIISHHVVPAVGLLPQAASVAGSVFLLRVRSGSEADVEGVIDGEADLKSILRAKLTHPLVIFAYDVVLAAALMIVLVFTWLSHGSASSLSMLAAYATMPLLASFFAHLLLAVQALYDGLAIHGLVQYLAWRTVPPNCPKCSHRLRPGLPELPWFKSVKQDRGEEYAPLLAGGVSHTLDDDTRLMQSPEPEPVQASEPQPMRSPQPEAIQVRRKDRKKKTDNSGSSDDAPSWVT